MRKRVRQREREQTGKNWNKKTKLQIVRYVKYVYRMRESKNGGAPDQITMDEKWRWRDPWVRVFSPWCFRSTHTQAQGWCEGLSAFSMTSDWCTQAPCKGVRVMWSPKYHFLRPHGLYISSIHQRVFLNPLVHFYWGQGSVFLILRLGDGWAGPNSSNLGPVQGYQCHVEPQTLRNSDYDPQNTRWQHMGS